MNLFLYQNRLVLLFTAFIAMTGCSVAPPQPSVTASFNGMKIYSSTSEMQSSFLRDRTSDEHFCDSRISDVADTASTGIGLSASLLGQKEGISEGASRGAVALGGRSPAVLITREVMYRTCELVMNLNLEKKEALDLYIQTLNVVLKVAQMDKNAGTSSMVAVEPVQNIKMIDTTTPPDTKPRAPVIQESNNGAVAVTSSDSDSPGDSGSDY